LEDGNPDRRAMFRVVGVNDCVDHSFSKGCLGEPPSGQSAELVRSQSSEAAWKSNASEWSSGMAARQRTRGRQSGAFRRFGLRPQAGWWSRPGCRRLLPDRAVRGNAGGPHSDTIEGFCGSGGRGGTLALVQCGMAGETACPTKPGIPARRNVETPVRGLAASDQARSGWTS
jgi:hypothetical protein